MSSSTADGNRDEPDQEIRLVNSGTSWVATDTDTGVASQGETRREALENLDDALALYRRDSDEAVDQDTERELLREMGIDPEEVERGREDSDGLPDFMR